MLFTWMELLDIVIMSLAVGFIFKDAFMPARKLRVETGGHYEPLEYYKKKALNKIGGEGFLLAIIVAAPAVIFHELGHKFIATGFGLTAVFHAAYFWLALGVILKLLNFGFIFFVPAYVSIAGAGLTPLNHSAVAFAGPAINLILFAIPFLLIRFKGFTKNHRQYIPALVMMSRINLFLFIFNMLPIPMFDGWSVYSGIIQTFL